MSKTQPEISQIRDELRRGTRVISLSGLTSISAKSYVLSSLQKEIGKTFVVITDSNRELETWENDLEFWNEKWKAENEKLENTANLGDRHSSLVTLPSFEMDVYSAISPHAETLERRALGLWNLSKESANFVLTSAKSLITLILSPTEMQNLGAHLERDKDFLPEKLIEKLTGCGYVREEPLKNIGEFSVRGGIVDVWSPDAENPVRIEFFGDTVDSIREFDADTQLSIGQLKEVSLAPMREFSATPQDLKDWAFFAKDRFADEKFARNLKDRTQFAEEGETFNGWEFLINLLLPKT
ncbi:MAG TPA: hypothetical protein PKY82_30040, partial [Pyrinomonadaceae bacterium]|nr:hypothetical protein [Pyrinomonadaceae bacterium]